MLSILPNIFSHSCHATAPNAKFRRCSKGLGFLVSALFSTAASAAFSDTLHPFVSSLYSYDDNLLRLPEAASGLGGPRGDTVRQVQGGVLFERPIGRQVITAQAKLSRVTFGHYKQLNYNGKDISVALDWHLASTLSGHAGTSYSQTLTPFTDIHSSERNLRVQHHDFVDGNWRFHPSWQVRAGLVQDRFAYDTPIQRINNRTEDSTEAGVDYLAISGSRIGLVARHMKGQYPFRRVIQGISIDDGYSQNELKVKVYWAVSGVTQVQLLAGWASREHNFFTERDASGVNGRANVSWRPLPTVRLNLETWREFAAVENNLVSNSLNKGASLNGSWDMSAKIQATASLRSERRAFDVIKAFSGLVGAPSDNSRSLRLGLTYAPLPALQLSASAFRESRSGDVLVGNGSYMANGASINATLQF